MRLNIISTTWVTLMTLAALLMSGVATSAGMMSNSMSHMMQSTSAICQTQQMSSHHQMQMEHGSESNADMVMNQSQCQMSADIVNNCCDTTCASAAAILIVPDELLTATTSLALFSSPKFGDVIHTTRSLERPPTA